MNTYKLVSNNKKANFLYSFSKKYEAGIVLFGTEIKSLRFGKVSINESFAKFDKKGELYVYNFFISPYEFGNINNKDPLRPKKLLLSKNEIKSLIGSTKEKGLTIVPIKLYINNKGKAKIEIGLGKGKKVFDKRETIKRRDDERNINRELKNNK